MSGWWLSGQDRVGRSNVGHEQENEHNGGCFLCKSRVNETEWLARAVGSGVHEGAALTSYRRVE